MSLGGPELCAVRYPMGDEGSRCGCPEWQTDDPQTYSCVFLGTRPSPAIRCGGAGDF